jgi:oligoendopeptidase F
MAFPITSRLICRIQSAKFELLNKFDQAESAEEQNKVMKEINSIRNDYSTMYNICYVRHTINTNDEFYQVENDFYDESNPIMQKVTTDFYKHLVASTFRKPRTGILSNSLVR